MSLLRLCSFDAQILLGGEEGGQLPPGGWDWPQATLQPAHTVQGPQVRSGQPLQECAEVTVRGRRPATRKSNFPEPINPEIQTLFFVAF